MLYQWMAFAPPLPLKQKWRWNSPPMQHFSLRKLGSLGTVRGLLDLHVRQHQHLSILFPIK
jgi:hypothetical protein